MESIRSNNSKKESKRNLEENKSTSKDETLQEKKDLNISNASKTSNPDLNKSKDDSINQSQIINANNQSEDLKASSESKNELKTKDIELNSIKENNENE